MISVVVPVYQEEDAVIAQTIEDMKRALTAAEVSFEIVAVNDSSTESNRTTLDSLQGIEVIHHPSNRGYGASLKSGIKHSRYDWILIIDADGTYPVQDVPLLLAEMSRGDMVVGSREKKGSAIPLERKHAKIFLNHFASYLSGKRIPDLNSGFRLFKKDIVLRYWELFPDRFSFTSTLTMTCLIHGYETVFVPIDYFKRAGKSSIRPTDFLGFLKLIIKLSLFFKPIKVFTPLSLGIFLAAMAVPLVFFVGITDKFLDTTFIVLCATSLQTFFFGLLAEIVIHNRS